MIDISALKTEFHISESGEDLVGMPEEENNN